MCIFRKILIKKNSIYIEIYVNDMIIAVSTTKKLNKFKRDFNKRFKIKKLDNLKKILNIQIIRDQADQIIYID